MPKLGRNDICWCGSGKKYKNCHLQQDEAAEARTLVTHNLLQRLAEYALREFRQDFESAYQFFTGHNLGAPRSEDELNEFDRGLDYFIFDYPLADDGRVIERFIAEQGRRLTAEERALATDWQHSYTGAFEVLSVQRGVGMRVRDLVSGDEFDVLEKKGTMNLSRWEIIITRMMRVRDHYEMGAYSGLRLPSRYRDWLRGYLEEQRSHYELNHPEATYEEFAHASSQLLHQFVMGELMSALSRPPTIVTAEGDMTEFCSAAYDVLDYSAALAGLERSVEFVAVESEGEEHSFSWQERGASLDLLKAHGPGFTHQESQGAARGGVRNLGSLSLTREMLTFEATSRRRLEAGKELLSMRLGRSIRHRGDEYKSVDEVLAKAPETPEEEPAEQEMPEELEALEAEMAAKYHHQWLDQPIPMLDGQTPREAIKTFGGRVLVIRLLKQVEAMEDRRAGAGHIPFDLNELKTELGITDQDLIDESRLEDLMRDALDEIVELTDEDRVDDALAAWRTWREKYPIKTIEELDFAEVWDLADILNDAVDILVYRLAMFERYPEALALLEEYLKLEPDDPDTMRAQMAEIHAESGETDLAVRELQDLRESAPDNFNVIESLANVQRDLLNRPDDAIATMRGGLETVDPDYEYDLYHEILNIYIDLGRFEEAEEFCRAENEQEDEKDYLGLTKLLLARGDLERARESANQIEEEPARRYWLGRVEARAGNYDAARELWADDLNEPPFDDWLFWSPWIQAHLRLRDFDPVIDQVNPSKLNANAFGYFELALAHAAKGNLDRAAELAQAGHLEVAQHSRRLTRAGTLRSMGELAEELKLSPAAREALQF